MAIIKRAGNQSSSETIKCDQRAHPAADGRLISDCQSKPVDSLDERTTNASLHQSDAWLMQNLHYRPRHNQKESGDVTITCYL